MYVFCGTYLLSAEAVGTYARLIIPLFDLPPYCELKMFNINSKKPKVSTLSTPSSIGITFLPNFAYCNITCCNSILCAYVIVMARKHKNNKGAQLIS